MGLFSGLFNFGMDVWAAKTIHDVEAAMGEAYDKGFKDGKEGEPKMSFKMRQKLAQHQRRNSSSEERIRALDTAAERLFDAYDEGYRDGQQTRRTRSYD